MKTVWVTHYTQSKHFEWKKCLVQDPAKWKKKNCEMCIKYEVHIYTVWTIIMQSLNI